MRMLRVRIGAILPIFLSRLVFGPTTPVPSGIPVFAAERVSMHLNWCWARRRSGCRPPKVGRHAAIAPRPPPQSRLASPAPLS